MARWRLMNAHYLNVPGTEWEYVEISRATGKQARVRYPVPLFLDPRDPADHNYPGEIIVAHAKKVEMSAGGPKVQITGGRGNADIIFVGDPTPDMEPLDEEAEKISADLQSKWVLPMSEMALPSYGDYSQSILSKFDEELSAAIRRVGMPQGVTNTSVKSEDFEKLQKQVEVLTKQNADLLAKINGKPVAVQPK